MASKNNWNQTNRINNHYSSANTEIWSWITIQKFKLSRLESYFYIPGNCKPLQQGWLICFFSFIFFSFYKILLREKKPDNNKGNKILCAQYHQWTSARDEIYCASISNELVIHFLAKWQTNQILIYIAWGRIYKCLYELVQHSHKSSPLNEDHIYNFMYTLSQVNNSSNLRFNSTYNWLLKLFFNEDM